MHTCFRNAERRAWDRLQINSAAVWLLYCANVCIMHGRVAALRNITAAQLTFGACSHRWLRYRTIEVLLWLAPATLWHAAHLAESARTAAIVLSPCSVQVQDIH